VRQKQAREALAYLESATQQKPKELRPRLYLAQALVETGDLSRADQAYLEAAELDPRSAAAQLGLAQVRARQNRLKEAEPHFRKAAELDPTFRGALLQLGSLYENNGQKAEAMAVYQEFPDNVAARERLGNLLLEVGKPSEAIPHLEWVVQRSPSTASRVALALAYRKMNQPEKELPLLEQAVAAEPSNLDLHMIYGRTLRDKRNFAEAARQFLQVVQAKPDHLEAWNELAAMLVSMEDLPQALAALDRIKALGGETAGHLYLRAIMLDKAHDYKGALENYEKFLAASQGKHPDEEFKARQRARIIRKELDRR
jgi:tetratricopeptide (TPR) repeat protein